MVSDFCGEHLMIEGSIPLAAEALIVYGDERLTGILAGTTADSTVVFAATHSGTVRKILVKTRQLALEYGTIQLTKPPQRHSPIRSIQFDSTRRFLFALTKTQVSPNKCPREERKGGELRVISVSCFHDWLV